MGSKDKDVRERIIEYLTKKLLPKYPDNLRYGKIIINIQDGVVTSGEIVKKFKPEELKLNSLSNFNFLQENTKGGIPIIANVNLIINDDGVVTLIEITEMVKTK